MFENPASWLIAGGLALGVIFGLIVRQYRMCLVAAVSNATLVKDYRYMLAFAMAALVAITGTQLLEINAMVEVSKAGYRNGSLDLVGVILGGLVFGIGATLAGGDATRVLVLAGQGSKAGWTALFFFAIFAAVAQFGLLADIRVSSMTNTSISLAGGDAGIAEMFSVSKWIVLIVVDVLLIAFIAVKWKQHADFKLLLGGAMLGATVIAAWYTSGVLAFDDFNPKAPSAISVSGPMSRAGNMLVAGDTPTLSLAVSFVIGVIAISFVMAIITRQFQFTAIRTSSGMIALGGALMGIGGTVAYGCNVGQGFSGLSTLSLESIVAVIAMLVGIKLATRWLERG